MSGDDDPITVDREQLAAELERAIDKTLTRRRSIDEDTHKLHHAYIEQRMEHRRRRDASMRKIRESVIGWAIIAVISGIGTLIYRGWQAMQRAAGGGH